MNTMVFSADDAARALDEAVRRLGPDALILSTRQVGGRVEVTATAPDAAELPPEPAHPPEPARAAPPPPAEPAPPPRAPAAFAAEFLRRIAAEPAAAPPGLPPLRVLPPDLPPRIVLAGPPGAGRSMLAARLAAESLRTEGAARPRLIAPRADLLVPPGRLSGWARLAGLQPERPVWPQSRITLPPLPTAGETQIIDLSDLPAFPAEALPQLVACPGAALWLVLPAGLHPRAHDLLCPPFSGRASCIALTRTDICPPTADDLALETRHGIPVGLYVGSPGLLDALSPGLPDMTGGHATAAAPADRTARAG